jgi:hypothetical protein
MAEERLKGMQWKGKGKKNKNCDQNPEGLSDYGRQESGLLRVNNLLNKTQHRIVLFNVLPLFDNSTFRN